jgi:hypothetical protein
MVCVIYLGISSDVMALENNFTQQQLLNCLQTFFVTVPANFCLLHTISTTKPSPITRKGYVYLQIMGEIFHFSNIFYFCIALTSISICYGKVVI